VASPPPPNASGHAPRRFWPYRPKGALVSVAKITELTAESTDSLEDAVKEGLGKAGETLHNIRDAWVAGQEVEIRDGTHSFQVHVKVTFILD
jgi:dodecin